MDAPGKAQGAASIMSEASMLSNRSTSGRQFGMRDSAHNQGIITILHPSPGAGNRSGGSASTGGPGSLTNAERRESEHRRRIGDTGTGASFRGSLERNASDQLDLVPAKTAQLPLQGAGKGGKLLVFVRGLTWSATRGDF